MRSSTSAVAEDVLLSAVQLLGGVLFVAMVFAAAAGRAAIAAAIEHADARAGEPRDLRAADVASTR